MKATETTLQPIIEGAKQYVIPLFQRPYSWGRKEWELLWNDLVELSEMERPRNHFLGSIVTMQTVSVPEGVPKFLLIDGQQRLTTIFILLALIRDRAGEEGELADEINNTLLVNPYKKGTDRFKLLPTQLDREGFEAIIHRERPIPEGNMAQAYDYFSKKAQAGGVDARALKKVVTGSLSMVSIVLGADDNPYLVFESLNAKGLPLTQSDLIRNFFFMRIHPESHDEIYGRFWEPMQVALKENLTEFIRHYLMKGGSLVRQNDVYFALKEQVGQGDALEHLRELSRYAVHYGKLLDPANEADPSNRRALERLQKLEVTTAFPFLLNCFEEQQAGRLSTSELVEILQIVENYVIRRFVCGVPTNQLNKIFPPLFGQAMMAGQGSFIEGLKRSLQTKGYPKDVEFRSRLADAKLYGGDRAKRGKLILERLETHHGHREQVNLDGSTVEHVMPQTLTEEWQSHLGADWDVTHELLLHTLGNLTLTGYNSPLSNEPFAAKKAIFGRSHIDLNRYFDRIETWDREAIEARASHLADVALSVWPYFGEENAASSGDLSARTVPVSLKVLGQNFEVESWRDVIEQTLNTLADSEPEKFDRVIGSFKRFVRHDNAGMHSWRRLANGMYVNVNLSSRDIKKFCSQILDAIELTVDDWHVETA